MIKQPDFEGLFVRHFGSKPRKVYYEARFDSSLLHDLQFLSSLVHDSVFHPGKVIKRGRELRLPLTRECWELPKIEKDGVVHLYVAQAVLALQPVVSARWELPYDEIGKIEDCLTVKGLHLCFDYWEPDVPGFTLLVHGIDWKCVLKFAAEGSRILLKDQTVPIPDWEFFQASQ